ncbi:MAG: FHIPEP family type III secretion protein, partial [Fuerstiella sp.]
LTDRVRVDLGRLICEPYRNSDGLLRIIELKPQLDSQLRQSIHEGTLAIGPGVLSRFIDHVKAAFVDAERLHQPLAILVDQKLRRPLKKLLSRPTPDLAIVAYQELPGDMNVETVVVLPHQEIMGADAIQRAGTTDGSALSAAETAEAA